MKRLFWILLLGITMVANAQPDSGWVHTYGGLGTQVGNSVRQTMDGGFIVAGLTHVPGFFEQAFLLKVDANGMREWDRAYGDSTHYDSRATDVRPTADGGYLVAGIALFNARVWKTDGEGDLVWMKEYSTGIFPTESRIFLCPESGSLLMVSRMSGYGYPQGCNEGGMTLRLDAGGDSLWNDIRPCLYYTGSAALGGMEQSLGGTVVAWGKASFTVYMPRPPHISVLQFYFYRRNVTGELLLDRVFNRLDPTTPFVDLPIDFALEQGGDPWFLFPASDTEPQRVMRVDTAGGVSGVVPLGFPASQLEVRSGGEFVTCATHGTAPTQNLEFHAYTESGAEFSYRAISMDGDANISAMITTADSAYVVVGSSATSEFAGTDILLLKTHMDSWLLIGNPSVAATVVEFMLSAYPNPFNATTKLVFELPTAAKVELVLFDLTGRAVRTLAEKSYPAGRQELALNANGLPSGIYFARLTAGAFTKTRKLLLVR